MPNDTPFLFKTKPKNFPTPTNTKGYDVVGVSVEIQASSIGNVNKFAFKFAFFKNGKDENGEDALIETDSIIGDIPRKITIPKMGDVDIVAGLLSSKRQTIYLAASVLAAKYEYELLPLEEQDIIED